MRPESGRKRATQPAVADVSAIGTLEICLLGGVRQRSAIGIALRVRGSFVRRLERGAIHLGGGHLGQGILVALRFLSSSLGSESDDQQTSNRLRLIGRIDLSLGPLLNGEMKLFGRSQREARPLTDRGTTSSTDHRIRRDILVKEPIGALRCRQ